jgi:6-phosphogluconolactonase
MESDKIHIFENPHKLAEAVANLLMQNVNQKDGDFHLAISGGNTANLVFQILANDFKDKIIWNQLKLFWVDERCVPASNKESNFGNARELLIKNVPIPKTNIFNIQGENEPNAEAQRYQSVLVENLPSKNGLPAFDLILLGMGEDGHTASIFPNNLELLQTSDLVATSRHPQTGQIRVTITGNVIFSANVTIFLVTGKSKSKIVESIVKEKDDFLKYPAYYIFKEKNVEIFAAAETAQYIKDDLE